MSKLPILNKKKDGKGNPFSFLMERKEKTMFTGDFFKFLLGFSLIILLSFVVLSYFSNTDSLAR